MLLLLQAVESQKICTVMVSFCPDHINKVLDEKGQKSYISGHWGVMQSLKKNWLLDPKMTWGIQWILMRAVAGLKIWTLMSYFCQRYIMFEPKKSTEEELWKFSKFEEELTCALKNDMRNLANFDPTLKNFKVCTLMGFFSQII